MAQHLRLQHVQVVAGGRVAIGLLQQLQRGVALAGEVIDLRAQQQQPQLRLRLLLACLPLQMALRAQHGEMLRCQTSQRLELAGVAAHHRLHAAEEGRDALAHRAHQHRLQHLLEGRTLEEAQLDVGNGVAPRVLRPQRLEQRRQLGALRLLQRSVRRQLHSHEGVEPAPAVQHATF